MQVGKDSIVLQIGMAILDDSERSKLNSNSIDRLERDDLMLMDCGGVSR